MFTPSALIVYALALTAIGAMITAYIQHLGKVDARAELDTIRDHVAAIYVLAGMLTIDDDEDGAYLSPADQHIGTLLMLDALADPEGPYAQVLAAAEPGTPLADTAYRGHALQRILDGTDVGTYGE